MRKIIFVLFLMLIGFGAYASGDYDSPIYTDDANLAVGGWDPVSFFGSSPQEGQDRWKTEYKGAVWRFSSEENLDLFTGDPEQYAPAYGGYCAWAMNKGDLAPGKPEHWDVIDGRLYLNFSGSTRRKFLNDLDSMIENADARWPALEAALEGGSSSDYS